MMEIDWKFCVNVGLLGLLIYFIATSLTHINENFVPRPLNRDTETNINLNTYVPDSNQAPNQEQEQLAMKTQQSVGGPVPIMGNNKTPGPPVMPNEPDEPPRPVQEMMQGKASKEEKEKFDTLKFLDEPEQNYDNVFYLNGTADEVKQYNTYTNNWNTANFKSNILDVRHFFKRNPPSGIHPDAELKPPVTGPLPEPGQRRCFTDSGGKDAQLDDPDVWKYKHEMPMNGGQFLSGSTGEGVYGYDSLDGLYAAYSDKKFRKPNPPTLSGPDGPADFTGACGPNNSCNAVAGEQCQDDIRNGLGTPGRKWAARN